MMAWIAILVLAAVIAVAFYFSSYSVDDEGSVHGGSGSGSVGGDEDGKGRRGEAAE